MYRNFEPNIPMRRDSGIKSHIKTQQSRKAHGLATLSFRSFVT